MKMSCEFCGVRTSSFGLDMRDLQKLVPRLEVPVALKFAFEADRRNIPSMGDTSPATTATSKAPRRKSSKVSATAPPSRGIKVCRVSGQHSVSQVHDRSRT